MLAHVLNPYYLQMVSFILIHVMLGISMYITLSTGQLSLGQAGFMGIGAYTSTILTYHDNVPILAGLVCGAMIAGIAGIMIGLPALRLQGVYLAIATLGFGEVVRVLFINWESVTQGAIGISSIPHLGREAGNALQPLGLEASRFGLNQSQWSGVLIVVILLMFTLSIILFFVLQQRSRVGRAFAAIKMDEQAAEAMGVNIKYYKVLAFAQGAIVAGLAGALYAHVTSYISPSDFSYHRAVEILIFAVFGGSEVIWGSIFGATFLTALPEILRGVNEYRYMIYGALLVLMMAYRPQGVIDQSFIKSFIYGAGKRTTHKPAGRKGES